MNPGQAGLLGFWVGGLVATVGFLATEWPGVDGLPPIARVRPVRFGALMVAMVTVWPAGLALMWQWQRQRRQQEADDAAEYERIEATRRDGFPYFCTACGAGCCDDDATCPGCGAELDGEDDD